MDPILTRGGRQRCGPGSRAGRRRHRRCALPGRSWRFARAATTSPRRLARLSRAGVRRAEREARAFVAAGRAAHAGSREEEASRFYQQAFRHASDSALQRAAANGELAAAIELERSDAPMLLAALEAGSSNPDDLSSWLGRRLYLETHFGCR